MKITLLPAFLLVAGVAAAQSTAPTAPARPEAAQVEARFARWLGCWRPEDDLEARVCITPDNPGVRLQTITAGKRTTDEALRGDGIARPIVEAGCKGTERTEWSKDNLRLFRYADVTCGTEGSRSVSAIAFFGRGPTWVNVEMVGGGDSRMLRVQRYRRVIDQEPPDGTRVVQAVSEAAELRSGTEASWDVDDVIEASSRMPAEVVQAALTEARERFALNRRSLIALADGGVAELTIDLMIGLTYPKRFVVRRGESSSMTGGISTGSRSYDPFFYWGSSYASCYSPPYGYQSYYGGCGDYYYDNWYGNGGGWVPVEPGQPGPPTPPGRQPEGRVVNGHGYTQVWPREAGPTGSRGNGASGSAEGGSGASSGGASTDTSGASPSGYSSGSSAGSSSDSGERVAVPRPPPDR
jgi:hypothetical protein